RIAAWISPNRCHARSPRKPAAGSSAATSSAALSTSTSTLPEQNAALAGRTDDPTVAAGPSVHRTRNPRRSLPSFAADDPDGSPTSGDPEEPDPIFGPFRIVGLIQ